MVSRVVVAGGTGFIGRALVRALRARGDWVAVLTRQTALVRAQFDDTVSALEWSPNAPGAWMPALADADAIVSLVGHRAVGVRYTAHTKRAILESRVVPTTLMADALSELADAHRPRVLVSASAVGYYGNRPQVELLDESSPAGSDFLASVCVSWEQAAQRALASGVRVVTPRIGVVLGPGGGALEGLKGPSACFLGGSLGSGGQAVSWIHLDDLVRVLLRCVDDEGLSGPVNATAPHPASNLELVRAVGAAMDRPVWLRVPSWALRLALGEGAGPLLGGQSVVPQVLRHQGFIWKHAELGMAVRAALGV